jgi:hypothetical protein
LVCFRYFLLSFAIEYARQQPCDGARMLPAFHHLEILNRMFVKAFRVAVSGAKHSPLFSYVGASMQTYDSNTDVENTQSYSNFVDGTVEQRILIIINIFNMCVSCKVIVFKLDFDEA